MSDKELVKRLRELRNNQYADPSTAPEFVFLDPDLPPSEWEKQYSMDVVYIRADRIEQLVATNEALTATLSNLVEKSNAMLDAFLFHETQQQDEAYDSMYATLAEIEGEKT
jgi:hypothetical protein